MKKQSFQRNKPFGMRDQIGYMMGDIGNDFFFMLVASFLMVYYTDVLRISAAAAGAIFFVARLWDAAADVTWGRFLDVRKPGPGGKFRPWILRMAMPLVISGVFLFVKLPGRSEEFYLGYAFLTYLIWGTLYSTVNIPYGSMASVITDQPAERATLSVYRTMGATLSAFLITAVGPLVLFVDNAADARRFTAAAIVCAVLSLASYTACYFLSTERVAPIASKQPASFKSTLQGVAKNRPLLSLLAASLLFMLCSLLLGAVNVYLFKDYFHNARVLSVLGLLQTVILLFAIPVAEPLVRRFGKKETAAAGLLLAAGVYMLLYTLPHLTAAQFLSLLAFGMLGSAFFQLMVWAFVTDAIDYQEYISGLREEGTVYAIYSFSRKVGQALAGGLGGYAIAAAGYRAGAERQTETVLEGIRTLATLVPALIFLFIFLILVFLYPLGREHLKRLAEDLQKQRKHL
ncbi:MFS transporter [Ectobacillus ponti]|uniref:Glycoside-pentoside-hexuronide (GPH):cation symporter n=1 Tax=Ectobacillus ponti TaxID=2961894 RepID=A0AA42BRT2_9BACI|nr:glycoside-pentoside-hexuronide (GPH):cation symporter [Ectobacillus ponti]MCP8971307.1 glycoside-pentoside-hexuronide (GPH):cation symporter [Ectobacillus ponti]